MEGSKKRKRELLMESDMDITTKVATANASLSVVTLISRHVPDERSPECAIFRQEEIVFWGSGTIIECEAANHKYVSTIITAASLFERTNGLQPHQLKVDVYLCDGKLCKGRVLACDFHYNLAAVIIKTHTPLKTATLRTLNDVISIHPSPHFQLPDHIMHPRSNLFRVLPDTKINVIWRSHESSTDLSVSSGIFGYTSSNTKLDCNELYSVNGIEEKECCGRPVINSSGEVIGITFYASQFLPVNIVSRWWRHFKSCGEYRRPWLGMEVANLHTSRLEFLEVFMMKFPYISTGVVVTKVAEDSTASRSGIRPKDVIVECNGKLVCSKLEFFDVLWNMVGENVEVNVLRIPDSENVKLNLTVGEATPDKFYKWRRNKRIAIDKEMKQTLKLMRMNN